MKSPAWRSPANSAFARFLDGIRALGPVAKLFSALVPVLVPVAQELTPGVVPVPDGDGIFSSIEFREPAADATVVRQSSSSGCSLGGIAEEPRSNLGDIARATMAPVFVVNPWTGFVEQVFDLDWSTGQWVPRTYRVIYYDPAVVAQADASFPKASWFFRAHEYGHHLLGHIDAYFKVPGVAQNSWLQGGMEDAADRYAVDFWLKCDPVVVDRMLQWLAAFKPPGDATHRRWDDRISYITAYRNQMAGPGIVTGITASDGTFADRVQVSWSAVPQAALYVILSSTTPNYTTANVLGSTPGLLFNDPNAVAGVTYYYWVIAQNAAGTPGLVGTFDAGRRGTGGMAAPAGVNASDGTFADRIRVTWSAVVNATGYRVLRGDTSVSSAHQPVGTVPAGTLSYDDFSAAAGHTWHYSVEPLAAGNLVGPRSVSDSGFRATGSPGQFSFADRFMFVDEAAGSVVLRVVRTNGLTGTVGVTFRTLLSGWDSISTAEQEVDFAVTETSLVFQHGESEKSVSVPLINDLAAEGAEYFDVALVNPTGGAELLDPWPLPSSGELAARAVVNVRDDDLGPQPVAQGRWIGLTAGAIPSGLASDPTGDVIVCESPRQTPGEWGGVSVLNVRKLNAAGQAVWSLPVTNLSGPRVMLMLRPVGCDTDRNVFVAGSFAGEVRFGTVSAASAQRHAIVAAKLSAAGSVQWVRSIALGHHEVEVPIPDVNASLVLANGQTILACLLTGSATVGNRSLEADGGTDLLLVSFTADGTLAWTRQFRSPGLEMDVALAADRDGFVVLRNFDRSVLVESGASSVLSLTDPGRALVVLRFDATGTLRSHRQFGTERGRDASGVHVQFLRSDSSGHLWLAGRGTAPGPESFASDIGRSLFLMRVNAGDQPVWVRTVYPRDFDYHAVVGLEVGADGSAYLCGAFNDRLRQGDKLYYSRVPGDIFLARFDQDGNPLGFRLLGEPASNFADFHLGRDGRLWAAFVKAGSDDTIPEALVGPVRAIRDVPRLRIAGRSSEAVVRLVLSGEGGETYQMEASSDFSHWSDLPIGLMPDSGELPVTFPLPAGHEARFFRLH